MEMNCDLCLVEREMFVKAFVGYDLGLGGKWYVCDECSKDEMFDEVRRENRS